MNNEIEKIKRERDKAWQLVEELEEENQILSKGLNNAALELRNMELRHQETIKKLGVTRLKTDNKFLKEFIINKYSINPCDLGQILRKNFDLFNNNYK